MFGFARSATNTQVRWSPLLSLLEDDDRRAAVERLHPQPGRESYLRVLRRCDRDVAASVLVAGRSLDQAACLSEQPTIAVAGMLNSGKTSVVASFLEDSGRARALRGINNSQGTHRFVLWLPSLWKADAELWRVLLERIGDTLGEAPELLDEDPLAAHQQYNNQAGDAARLAVPLIATDAGLDAFQVALLDCPDIVSDASFGLGSPESRRELLRKAATLCSAFLVVTTPEQVRDHDLSDHLRIAQDLMAGVPRMLAVNKIRPNQSPEQVRQAFQPLADRYGVERIYAAYDFEIRGSERLIPQFAEQRVQSPCDPESALPVFFSLVENFDDHPPAAIGPERFLTQLPRQLDRAELFTRFQKALELSLKKAVWSDGLGVLQTRAAEAEQEVCEVRTRVLRGVLEFFARRQPGGQITELRLHQSQHIVQQLTEALYLAAPWYARWGLRLSNYATGVRTGMQYVWGKLLPLRSAEETVEGMKQAWRKGKVGGLLTVERLYQALQLHDVFARLPAPDEEADRLEILEQALRHFDHADFTQLDSRALEDAVRQMWQEIPATQKIKAGLTPMAAAVLAFGSVLLVPIDFGGSAVIAAASITELLAAAGLTAAATYWSGKQTANQVEQQAARRQLSDFHAVLCDVLGVARPLDPLQVHVARQDVALPLPTIAGAASRVAPLPLWRVRDEFSAELAQVLPPEQ